MVQYQHQAVKLAGWNILSDKLSSNSNRFMLSGSGVISSSNFYLDETGSIWAASGGFAGTYNNPNISIYGQGILVKDSNSTPRSYFGTSGINTGSDGWRLTTSSSLSTILNSNFDTGDGAYWTSSVVGLDCGFGVVTAYSSSGGWNFGPYSGSYFAYLFTGVSGSTNRYCETTFSQQFGSIKENQIYTINFQSIFVHPLLTNSATFTLQQYSGSQWVTLQSANMPYNVIGYKGIINPVWNNNNFIVATGPGQTGDFRLLFKLYGNEYSYAYYDTIFGLSAISITKPDYFADINDKGIYLYSSPTSYVQIGRGKSVIRGSNVTMSNVLIQGNLTAQRNKYILESSEHLCTCYNIWKYTNE